MADSISPTETLRRLKLFEKMVKDKKSYSDEQIKEIFYKLLHRFISCDDKTVEAIIEHGHRLFHENRPAVVQIISQELNFYFGSEKKMANA